MLFEMAGLLYVFEKRMEELLHETDKIEQVETHEKLQELLELLKELKKIHVEMNQIKQQKKQRLHEIGDIKEELKMSLEGINKQNQQIGEMEVEIVKLKSQEKKRVPDELIQGVKVEFRGLVKNILEKVQEIELNEDRTLLICTTCDDNW